MPAQEINWGDMLKVLPAIPADSIDSIITDPPYDLAFMGKTWDSTGIAFDPATWRALARVLKPGGYVLTFGGGRTYHRMAVAMEDAGLDIRDSIAAWLYGSGFPKSHDISKALDRITPATDEAVSIRRIGEPDKGRSWEGWGTALKPAWEPILVARKGHKGTVAANVLRHGVGGLNIDATRVGPNPGYSYPNGPRGNSFSGVGLEPDGTRTAPVESAAGRWPANIVLAHHPLCVEDAWCHDDCWVAELDNQSGIRPGSKPGTIYKTPRRPNDIMNGGGWHDGVESQKEFGYGDTGGASRFFPTFRYQAKAPASERPEIADVKHPTVKPLGLMRWLVKLVTPAGGTVLDPFAGSGSTIEACHLEGMACVAIEEHWPYVLLVKERCQYRSGLELQVYDWTSPREPVSENT